MTEETALGTGAKADKVDKPTTKETKQTEDKQTEGKYTFPSTKEAKDDDR